MLVSATDLLRSLPEVIMFDCRHDLMNHARGRALYDESHVVGAHFAPVETALAGTKTGQNGRHPLPTPSTFAAFLQAHGVTRQHRLVAYDDAGGLYAARFWWMARALNLPDVALLDGGWQAWLAAGGPVTSTPSPATPAAAPLSPPQAWPGVVTVDALEKALGRGECLVVDARAAERFRGEVEPIDPVGGHIPGAVNHFYRENLTPDLRFRPRDELRQIWDARRAGRPAPTLVHQCGSGITACANLLAMELAGLNGSQLYAGSWSEWVADPRRPVAKGA